MPTDLNDNPPSAQTEQPLDYIEIQRIALQEMLELSAAAVAPLEEEIERRRQEISEEAEHSLGESTVRIETRFQEELKSLKQAHAEWVAQLEREYRTALENLETKTETAFARGDGEFLEVEKEALRLKEDNLLMAETVAHATLKGLRGEFKSIQQQTAGQRQRVEALRDAARGLLRGYGYEPGETAPAATPAAMTDEAEPAAEFDRWHRQASERLQALRTVPPPRLFPNAASYVYLVILCAASLGAAALLDSQDVLRFLIGGPAALAAALAIGFAVALRLRRAPLVRIGEIHAELQRAANSAEAALDRRLDQARRQLEQEEEKATKRRERELREAERAANNAISTAEQQRAETRSKAEEARAQRLADYENRRENALKQAVEEHERQCRSLQERHDRDLAEARRRYDQRLEVSRRDYEAARARLEARWDQGLAAIRRLLDETVQYKRRELLDWNAGIPADWKPSGNSAAYVPFGHWRIELDGLSASVRQRAEFLGAYPPALSVPALLKLPERCSLLLQTGRTGRQQAIDTLKAVMLRLLTSLPPGRVRFTIVDPVGLGENFAGFMHLGDYEEELVGGRIWTESEHIESRMTELTGHMENVIQKYLRNEFETIEEYNRQAGQLAEPYRFLVIADFPANFNEGAARRLNSIVNSGARCGVFTLIAQDLRLPVPPETQIEDLESGSLLLTHSDDGFRVEDELRRRFALSLDAPPSEEALTRLLHAVGREAKDSLRVEVPFGSIAPPSARIWSGDARKEISVPLGHTGAVRLQHLRLGRGIAQHALIAGKTGSGKSTLLHVLITNLGLWYGPDEVEFYLVDFKKGVEFKTYVTHRLPHARAIAIESDREFGVSVLQRIDAELARRGDLFRGAGVQDLAAYREQTGNKFPRTLLIVDEFQVFFAEDDRLSQEAGLLLDRLVRQGRAFGIHVLLGTQTLGGAAGLARSTMGQMAVRVALSCSEADSQLILDDSNVAARLLSRPGEAIYNDAGGLVEGNSPFQTAWLPDEERSVVLENIRRVTEQRGLQRDPPIVFEGNAPADVRQNRILAGLLAAATWPTDAAAPRAWLGEAVAIKDPTAATFKRQSGANLLIIGQREDAAPAMMAAALLCLGAQHAPSEARFVILDGRPPEERQPGRLEDVARLLPHEVRIVEWRDVPAAIDELAREARRRLEEDDVRAPAVYVLVHGLQRYRQLRRQEEDFRFSADDEEKPPAPDKQFAEVLREGPPLGIHALVWADTLGTLERTFDRQTLGEFDNRVLFQMSAADSSNLIDTPAANSLGFYRALYYSEEQGTLEKFRPYAVFDDDWLAHVKERFARRK